MTFILNKDFISKLSTIRSDYEARSNIPPLNESSQPRAISLFFGAKDVETRNKQIHFIEQWLSVLMKDLPSQENKEFDLNRCLRALQVMVGLCFYVKSQISESYVVLSPSSSVLGQLIDEAMGITRLNPIDEEVRQTCLLSTDRYLSNSECREKVNSVIAPESYSEIDWHLLINFVKGQTQSMDMSFLRDYPITTYAIPLFSRPMELAGITIGFCAGQTIANTTKIIPVRDKLTAAISTGVFMFMGPGAGLGVALLAPTCASRILDTFCGISLAVVMGTAMKILGQGLGFGVGMSLDLSWKLLNKMSNVILTMQKEPQTAPTGISLIDGSCFINGESVELVCLGQLNEPLEEDDFAAQPGLSLTEASELPYYNIQSDTIQTIPESQLLLIYSPIRSPDEEQQNLASSSIDYHHDAQPGETEPLLSKW